MICIALRRTLTLIQAFAVHRTWQYPGGVPSSELSYTQDGATNTTTLTVVRPVSFSAWPINMTGPTYVVFATGNRNTLSRHSSNRGVGGHLWQPGSGLE
jgi:hypothetical protein